MKERITYKNYKDVYNELSQLQKKANINQINYFTYPDSKRHYGGYAKRKGIYLTTDTLDDYDTHPYLLKFFASHELIHFIYRDYSIFETSFNPILSHKKYNAERLLREMRANIEGARLAELEFEEIKLSQKLAQERNNSSMRSKSYKYGYPDREMITEYCIQHKVFDKNIATRILDDYCNELNIKNKKEFIKEIVSNFHFNQI